MLCLSYMNFLPYRRLLLGCVVALLYVFSPLLEVVIGLCCGSAICLFFPT